MGRVWQRLRKRVFPKMMFFAEFVPTLNGLLIHCRTKLCYLARLVLLAKVTRNFDRSLKLV